MGGGAKVFSLDERERTNVVHVLMPWTLATAAGFLHMKVRDDGYQHPSVAASAASITTGVLARGFFFFFLPTTTSATAKGTAYGCEDYRCT